MIFEEDLYSDSFYNKLHQDLMLDELSDGININTIKNITKRDISIELCIFLLENSNYKINYFKYLDAGIISIEIYERIIEKANRENYYIYFMCENENIENFHKISKIMKDKCIYADNSYCVQTMYYYDKVNMKAKYFYRLIPDRFIDDIILRDMVDSKIDLEFINDKFKDEKLYKYIIDSRVPHNIKSIAKEYRGEMLLYFLVSNNYYRLAITAFLLLDNGFNKKHIKYYKDIGIWYEIYELIKINSINNNTLVYLPNEIINNIFIELLKLKSKENEFLQIVPAKDHYIILLLGFEIS